MKNRHLQPLVVVAGPTGTGKSTLALELARRFGCYIINADSRQLYKELNTGTAKPRPERILSSRCWQINEIPHYLYGHISVEQNYNLSDYIKEVKEVVAKTEGVPILVGGTGLYIDSIVYGFKLTDTSRSQNLYENKSIEQLRALADKDLALLNESDAYNRRRLVRLLQSGPSYRKSLKSMKNPIFKCLYLVLEKDGDSLNQQLQNRIEEMFVQGLLEENIDLRKKYSTVDNKALQTIGYKEFDLYFNGEKSLEEVKELIYIHTRQYARKQKTWFKRNPDAQFISSYEQAFQLAENFFANL